MMDLFGHSNTSPSCSGLSRRMLNAAQGFPEFWAAWPSGPRKVAKQHCLNKWAKLECCERAEHILAHIEWMKNQPDWLKDAGAFIPQPMTYLNQQRWADWVPEPKREKKPDALAVIKAHQGAPMPHSVREKINQLRGRA